MILILVQFNIAILAAFGLDLILKLKKEVKHIMQKMKKRKMRF